MLLYTTRIYRVLVTQYKPMFKNDNLHIIYINTRYYPIGLFLIDCLYNFGIFNRIFSSMKVRQYKFNIFPLIDVYKTL